MPLPFLRTNNGVNLNGINLIFHELTIILVKGVYASFICTVSIPWHYILE